MKTRHYLSTLILIVASFATISCVTAQSGQEATPAPAPRPAPTPTPAPDPASVEEEAETAVLRGLEIYVDRLEQAYENLDQTNRELRLEVDRLQKRTLELEARLEEI